MGSIIIVIVTACLAQHPQSCHTWQPEFVGMTELACNYGAQQFVAPWLAANHPGYIISRLRCVRVHEQSV